MATAPHIAELSAKERDKEVRRVVFSSYLGSTLEYYDFLLYGTAAALVFGPVFFAGLPPAVALIASLGTFAAGYLARPLGGIIFGHFGDRVGRKKMLVISMLMMGGVSVLIGLVPPAEMIGYWGAVILVVLRVVQGIAIGGEWGGAVLMSLEHADPKKRGFLTSFTNAGAPSGSLLGTLVMAAVTALVPEGAFMEWGWRIPFLLSSILVLIGIFVRSKISESPLFLAALEKEESDPSRKVPLVEVLKSPRVLIIGIIGCFGFFGLKATFSTFGMTVATDNGIERSDVLMAFAVAQAVAMVAVLFFARLSDKFGRRPIIAAGVGFYIVASFPVFSMVQSGSAVLASLGFILVFLCHAASFGPMAAFVSEQFPTATRYTGASVVYQVASIVGGFAPMMAAGLYGADRDTTTPSLLMMGLCAMSLIAIWMASETRGRELQD
jgi:MFS family permease